MYVAYTICSNRGVSHYRILPVSRDIGWPVQQLDYFRYIKQHILTIELLYIGYNFKEIKKTAIINWRVWQDCVSLWSYMVTFVHCLYFVMAQIASGSQFNECPGGGGFETIKSCARVLSLELRHARHFLWSWSEAQLDVYLSHICKSL